MKHLIECQYHPSSEGDVLKGTHEPHHIPDEVVICDGCAGAGEVSPADLCIDTEDEGIWHYCQPCWEAIQEIDEEDEDEN